MTRYLVGHTRRAGALAIVIAAIGCLHAVADDGAEGFVPLFDGKSLEGWQVKAEKPIVDDQWSVHDGVLVAKPGWCWLSTKKTYGDFVLRLEWRIPKDGNSGVFVHVPDLKPGQHPHIEGIEVQVLDDAGPQYAGKLKPYQFSGSIYGAVPAKQGSFHGAGQWNRYEITCKSSQMCVVYNGQQVAEADLSQDPVLKNRPRRGYIGLQNHGSGVEYRNIMIKVLD